MPSAVDILQEKRLKAEGEVKTPGQIVEEQIDEIDKGLPGKKEKVETKKVEVEDNPDDNQDDDDIPPGEEEDEDLDEQELKEARMLYKTLKSKPDEARGLIADLANRMGMPLAKIETKKEEKQVKKILTDRLKDALGPELGFIAEKIGPIFEEALEEERHGLVAVQQAVEVQQLTKESETALSKLAKETNGLSRKFESKMVQLMDKFPSSPEISTEEYIRGIAAIAMGSKLQQVATSKVTGKINRNANDVPGRLASKGSGAQEEPSRVQVPDKKLGTRGAVLFALSQLQNDRMPKAGNRK
jgi:hypothetical protein